MIAQQSLEETQRPARIRGVSGIATVQLIECIERVIVEQFGDRRQGRGDVPQDGATLDDVRFRDDKLMKGREQMRVFALDRRQLFGSAFGDGQQLAANQRRP